MYCPSCGSEERQLSQFCRTCGTDLRAVRAGLERPDTITSSAATARVEIGRSIAAKIRELDSGKDLKQVAEDVLPQIEKFLESPEEKRLRRMRAGVITSSVGLGAMLMFLLIALVTGQEELIVVVGAAAVAFIIGLGIMINGKLLSVQGKQVPDRSPEAASQNALDHLPGGVSGEQKEIPSISNQPLSVIEHTTHKLSNEPVSARRQRTSIENES
jgi:hypothetical protein